MEGAGSSAWTLLSDAFDTKRKAKDWSTGIESKANHDSSSGFSLIPKGATDQDLIEKYNETIKKTSGSESPQLLGNALGQKV
jgi:hypothetical protein